MDGAGRGWPGVLSLVGIGMAWNATSHAHDAEQALAANPLIKVIPAESNPTHAADWPRRSRRTLRCGRVESGGRQAEADGRSSGRARISQQERATIKN